MCQLLGMNCNTPTDVTFSFSGFAQRGGVTDHHSDGWGIAFFEYCFQVPANRLGITAMYIAQLKVMQEVITMTVFALFAVLYMKVPLTKNFLYASVCLVMAAFFIFRDKV